MVFNLSLCFLNISSTVNCNFKFIVSTSVITLLINSLAFLKINSNHHKKNLKIFHFLLNNIIKRIEWFDIIEMNHIRKKIHPLNLFFLSTDTYFSHWFLPFLWFILPPHWNVDNNKILERHLLYTYAKNVTTF